MRQDGRERGEAWLLIVSKLDLALVLREELDHVFARTYVTWTDVPNAKRCPVKAGLHAQIKRIAKEWASRGYEADAVHGDFVRRDGTHNDTYALNPGPLGTGDRDPVKMIADPERRAPKCQTCGNIKAFCECVA